MTTFSGSTTATLRLQYEAARDAGYSGRAAMQHVAIKNGITAEHVRQALFVNTTAANK